MLGPMNSTLVIAILSLVLPASAVAADVTARPYLDPAPVFTPSNQPAPIDAFRDDPILKSRWGPGDPNLVVPQFHFDLSGRSKNRSADRDPPRTP